MALVLTTLTASESHSSYGSVFEESVFGSETDVFGVTGVTVEDLLHVDFEVDFDISDTGGARYIVDSVEMEIFYQPTSITEVAELSPPFAPAPWASSCMALGMIILVGRNGWIAKSSDNGATFAHVASPTAATLRHISFDGQEFVAVGDRGTILRSADGDIWRVIEAITQEHVYAAVKSKLANEVVMGGTNSHSANLARTRWKLLDATSMVAELV